MSNTTIKVLLISTLCFFLIQNSFSQQAVLRGSIIDIETNEPLIGATVNIGKSGTTSDFDGKYELQIEAGSYKVEYSYIGYETVIQDLTFNAGEEKTVDIPFKTAATLLETATVTSGKFEKPLGEVTVSLEILKPELLDNTNSTSADEVLNKVPGVDIISGQPNIRGGAGWSYGAGSRVLVLVDDIPALQPDAGLPNWNDIPVENIEQIEIVKGAASALYGSSAMNGIINIRTAYAKSEPVTKLATFYTGYLSPKDKSKQWWDGVKTPFETGLSVSHRQKINKFDLVIGGYFLKSESYNKDSNSQYGRLSLGTRYRLNDRVSFGFNGNFNKGKSASFFYWKDWQSGAYEGDPGTLSNGTSQRYWIDPFLNIRDKKGNRHKIQGRYFNVGNGSNNNQGNGSQLFFGEYQFQKEFEKQGLVLTTGLVGMGTKVTAELYGDTSYTTSNVAPYVQLDKKFFNKLNFTTGIRYERNTINGPQIVDGQVVEEPSITESKPVFRVGLNYQVAPFTYLRSSWGQGYRFPTIAEKYISTTAGEIVVSPNPDLRSETGWTTEIGIKQGFRISKFEGFIDAAFFWSEYQDMMEFALVRTFPFAFKSQNIGNTVIKGFDFNITGRGKLFGYPTTLLTGYTYIDPKFKEFSTRDAGDSSVDYNVLKYRFKHTIKFDMETQFNKLAVGISCNYNSHMEAVDAIIEALNGIDEFRAANNNGTVLLSGRVSYKFTDKAKLSIIGNNLLNQEYTGRPGILEAPSNITARFDYNF